jgi:hypothetical protein
MIFSEWQPDGGYAYYESADRLPIGDDVPVMQMPPASGGIGVPVQDVGYPIPKNAKYVGSGDEPVGLMAPMARNGVKTLKGLGSLGTSLSRDDKVVILFLIGVLAAAAIANRG